MNETREFSLIAKFFFIVVYYRKKRKEWVILERKLFSFITQVLCAVGWSCGIFFCVDKNFLALSPLTLVYSPSNQFVSSLNFYELKSFSSFAATNNASPTTRRLLSLKYFLINGASNRGSTSCGLLKPTMKLAMNEVNTVNIAPNGSK